MVTEDRGAIRDTVHRFAGNTGAVPRAKRRRDDFARRTIPKVALNKGLRRSRDVFQRSKGAFFGFASDFFAMGADRMRERTGSPLYDGIER